jgi:SSS family solute:Na+ symporter
MLHASLFGRLNGLDLGIFIVYLLLSVGLGFWVARRGRGNPRSYFLGGNKLPWYVIGSSMVAADISGEHFISNVGAAYKYGIVVATGSWNSWIIYSLLILIFLPYYVRSGIYTMPQFLERRYDQTCRYVFALSLLVGYVAAMFAAALYSGALALESMLGVDARVGIWFFAIVTGAYTIYGGLTSAAWTDFMQMWVLLIGGIMVPILGLMHVGGLHQLILDRPDKFQVFLPPTHERFPFTGVFTGFLTVGLWYSCTSQHMVQRVLGAKDEWHARMGVILAGFLHIVTPFFFALPGIIAVKLLPDLGTLANTRPDQAYLLLVQQLIPTGLRGLILAAVAAALMSHLSTVLNSASTLVTMDLYRKARPESTEREQVVAGQVSGSVLLLIGIAFALYYITHREQPLFVRIQNVFFWLAPPFAVIFLLGLLWRRANAIGARATIVGGFIFTGIVQWWFDHNKWITQYFSNTYQHRALIAWAFCMLVMIVVSLGTAPPPAEKTDGIIWTRKYAGLPPEERARYTGLRDYRIWWALFVGSVLCIYASFLWFQFGRR